MSASPPVSSASPVRQFADLWRKHRALVLATTAAGALLAIAYAAIRTPQWKASQALVVRDEANGAISRQGRFDNLDAMKTAQETIAEISRNRAVAEAALKFAGPFGAEAAPVWPTQHDIEALVRSVTLTAPKGQEFGRSEVIYLAVTAPSRERAVALTRALCDQLESRLKTLRDRKAQSIVEELEKSATVARRDLDAATRQLSALEAEVGSDLGELRILNDSGAGDSNLRTLHTQVRNELRQARLAHDSNEEQLRLLVKAQASPDTLLTAPKGVLESQPSLRRLKDGLVDAQLRTAQLLGKMSGDHPEVRAARGAEEVIRGQVRDELTALVGGQKVDLQVSHAQIAALEKQQANVEQRLNRLAALRANYANLVAQTRQCSETVERAQKELADARATQAAAQSASLITRLDSPLAGEQAEGPSAAIIVACGALGGMMIGVGLAFLMTPVGVLSGRRLTDYLPRGRRASDRSQPTRRETDRAAANPTAGLPAGEDRRGGGDRRSQNARAGDGKPGGAAR